MSQSESGESSSSLSEVFDGALAIHEAIETSTDDSSSETFQTKLKKGILMLEDATKLVSIIDLFSRNENYKEVATEHLKYFLLPVLLGDLNSRLTDGKREDIVETCQIYYIDFLQRMVDYEFTECRVPKLKEIKEAAAAAQQQNGDAPQRGPRMPDLGRMNSDRDAKMARFREKKELEGEIKRLKDLGNPGTRDQDLERDLYIKMIKRFVFIAQDEIESLQMEVDILKHMAAVKAGKVEEEPVTKSRPFKPIIITQDKLQKEVYGLGYPSLPVLSVAEFYDQRVREGWFPPAGSGRALQDNALSPEETARLEEEEERENDDKEDRDDEEMLMKKRGMDEYKDDHRRGEGNRHNMG